MWSEGNFLANKNSMDLASAILLTADDQWPRHGMQGLAGEQREKRAHFIAGKIMRTDPGAAEERTIIRTFALTEAEILAGERRKMENPAGAQDPADFSSCRVPSARIQVADNVPGDDGIAGAGLYGDFSCIGKDDVAIPAGSNGGFCRDDRGPGEIQRKDFVTLGKKRGGILPAAAAQFENPRTGPEALNFWGGSAIELAATLVCRVPRGPVIGHGAP